MGRKSRQKRERRLGGGEGEYVWVRHAFGFFPEGVYVSAGSDDYFVKLRAGGCFMGSQKACIAEMRKATPAEIQSFRVTDKVIARHHLEFARKHGGEECECCRQIAEAEH